jgi:hypothetical protein
MAHRIDFPTAVSIASRYLACAAEEAAFTGLSTTFPRELHAGGSLLFIASSPCNGAIHLPSTLIEVEIKLESPSAEVHVRAVACFS